MSLPTGLATVTVACGPYTDARGNPCRGTITFTPSTTLTWSATGAVILPAGATVTLDSNGTITAVLPATDAVGLNATGFTYVVSYALTDAAGKKIHTRSPYRVQLPAATAAVALESLQPFPATGGVTVAVPTVQSLAGLTGIVTLAALQAILGVSGVGVGPVDGGGPGSVYGPAVVSTADGGDPSSVYGGIPGFDGGVPSSTYAGTTPLNGGTP